MSESLLEIEDLTIQYKTTAGPITAVSNASFKISEGEYFGLLGESGCGKSTLASSILGGLDDNGRVVSGKIKYQGTEIQGFSEKELNRDIRWEEISYIPQGSMNSLDPIEKISTQAWAIARAHTDWSKEKALQKFKDTFEIVGLQKSRIDDYPHQFSGGMQQRAIIALALFLEPSLIVADEPTTALDVIMQDQIFKYLENIKRETNTSMLLITHDTSVVFESCQKVAIMHSGQIAESGTAQDLYHDPKHPYSILLKESVPDHRYPDRELETIDGHPPETVGSINSCTFADRCPWAIDDCQRGSPPLKPVEGDDSHRVACIRSEEVAKRKNDGQATTPQKEELSDD